MKKLIILLIVATVFAVSCGGSKKTENDADILPDKDVTTDEEAVEPDEDDEEESSVPEDDLPLEEAVCKPNPCKKLENSNGKCEFDGDKSFICHCEEGYFWENGACVSPCDPDPCRDVKHSVGCYVKNRHEFLCSCADTYSWNGETCVDLCNPNPCQAHATCYYSNMTYSDYDCLCDDNFFSWGDKCMSPCDPNPCEGLSNATGECKASKRTEYSCVCEDNYVFNQDKGCVGPCNPNPCAGRENSTEVCITISEYEYACGCSEGLYWAGTSSGCTAIPECSSTSDYSPCKDSESGLMWTTSFESYYTEAVDYCNNLKAYGFTDWHLPTIDELRTLVINCPGLESGGACKVSESADCLSTSCYNNEDCLCQGESEYSVFSKFGYENGAFWSSSKWISGGKEFIWFISMTGSAGVGQVEFNDGYFALARCVRK